MTTSVQLTPISEILAFGKNFWHKVKFAKTSYSEFLLGKITKSSAEQCEVQPNLDVSFAVKFLHADLTVYNFLVVAAAHTKTG